MNDWKAPVVLNKAHGNVCADLVVVFTLEVLWQVVSETSSPEVIKNYNTDCLYRCIHNIMLHEF